MDNKTSGWKNVFSFTFIQQIKSKAFKRTSLLVGGIVFILVFLIMLFSGISKEEDKGQEGIGEELQGFENISDVYILDATQTFAEMDLFIPSYNEFTEADSNIEHINFNQLDGETQIKEAMAEVTKSENSLLINITSEEDMIMVKAMLPEYTNITEGESEALLEELVPIFELYKIGLSGLTNEQLTVITKPISTSIISVGEKESSLGEEIVKYLVPMLYSFALYIILIVYSQSIMNNLLIEKTSKLTEMLLSSVQPQIVITGKILAMSLVAILQFLFWILCGILGFVLGNEILKSRYPGYVNNIINVIETVQSSTGGSAFSATAIILSIIALAMGFLFYFSYAGIIGASLNKAEDISSGTGLFYIPVIIFGLSTISTPTFSEGIWVKFMNYFPFTSPFILPANILNGSIGSLQAIISIAILFLSIIVFFFIAGKLYKGLIFFKGEKVRFSNIIKAMKGKN